VVVFSWIPNANPAVKRWPKYDLKKLPAAGMCICDANTAKKK
jgi:hypothetical protein